MASTPDVLLVQDNDLKSVGGKNAEDMQIEVKKENNNICISISLHLS